MSAAPVLQIVPPTAPAYWPTDAMNEWMLCHAIRDVLDRDTPPENGDAVAYQLVDLQALLGTSASAMSNLFHKKEAARLQVLEAIAESGTKITPALQRDLVNAKCAGYNTAYEYADRLQSALVHSIDAMRSVLSWLKSEKQGTLQR